jgi:hypothetical protein
LYFAGIVDKSTFELNKEKISVDEALEIANNKYEGLMLFAIELNKKPTRTEISEITRAFNQICKTMPVGVVFKYGNEISIAISERFKYLQNWRQGEKVGKIIILRDINIENPHTGHLRILQDLQKHNAKTFNELHSAWLEVLDIKTLNKSFYKRLVAWYELCLNDITINLTAASKILNKKIDEELKPQAVIRVIIRMMFIWFMKEKGLIKNDFFKRDFANRFLKHENVYYNAILQNLFFAVLNKKIDDRAFRKFDKYNMFDPEKNDHGIFDVYRYKNFFKSGKEHEFLTLTKTIPFVNGGLFTCHDY